MNNPPTNRERPQVRPFATRRKGQGIVEFSLVFPILIVTILAMVEFGMYLKDNLGLHYATLNASRTVAAEGTTTSDDTDALLTISNTGLIGLNLSAVDYIEVYHAAGLTSDCPINYTCSNGNYPAGPVEPDMLYSWQYSPTLHTNIWQLDNRGHNDWQPGLRNDVRPTDVAGVYVKFHHYWVAPFLHNLNGGGIVMQVRSIMPIEPACYSDDAAFCQSQHGG